MEANSIPADNETWTKRFQRDFLETVDGRRERDRAFANLERFVERLRGTVLDEELDRLIQVIRIERLKLWGIDVSHLIKYATRGYLDYLPYLAGSISVGSILGLIVTVLTRDDPLVPVAITIVLATVLIIFSSLITFITWRLRARFKL